MPFTAMSADELKRWLRWFEVPSHRTTATPPPEGHREFWRSVAPELREACRRQGVSIPPWLRKPPAP